MPIVETGPKSNLFKILCMTTLYASLVKSNQKWSLYQPNNIFPIVCLWNPEKTGYSHANSLIWSKIKLVQDLMPIFNISKTKVREKSRECHNHKPQPFPDTKRKRKQTKPNKRKSSTFDEDPIKYNRYCSDNIFAIMSMGPFSLLWKQKFWPDLPPNLIQPIPNPIMVPSKFD